MLNAGDLSWMRNDVGALMPDSAILFQPSYTPDGAGGGSVAFTNMGTVAARIDPLPRKEKIELLAAAPRLVVEYLLTLPWNTTIDAHWRAILEGNGNTYEVVGMAVEHSWRVSVRAYVARVR